MQALSKELAWRIRQGADEASVASLERSLIAMIGSYCRMFILAGFHEKAVGVVQSLLEFHFFSPPLAGEC